MGPVLHQPLGAARILDVARRDTVDGNEVPAIFAAQRGRSLPPSQLHAHSSRHRKNLSLIRTFWKYDAAIEPITPIRILDTRTSNGGHQAPFAAGETIALQVRGRGAAPISGSVAIMGNATVVSGPSGGGYISIFPTGFPRPTV